MGVSHGDQREGSQQILAEMGAALAGSLDCAATLQTFARQAVEHIADLCVVALKEDECCAARVEVAHRDPATEEAARTYFGTDPRGPPRPLIEAMETQSPTLLPNVPPEWPLSGQAGSADLPRLADDDASALVVPLRARGDAVGAVLLLASANRRYGWADLELVEELARHAALALENDRLYSTIKRALAAHEETLSFVAHDLRNPLNVITMAAQMLLERAPESDEFTRHWLGAISHSADRIEALINDLLTAARTSTGRPVLDKRKARADLLVREAAAGYIDAAERKGVRLDVREPGEALQVVVDLDSAVRALSNLIGNALKFTPPSGSIEVAAERLDDDVRFSVSDTGCGIHPDHIPHVFDRFWRAPGTQRDGSGLGLAIVKGVVEAHRGRVWVESELDHGTTFFFTIPLSAGPRCVAEKNESHREPAPHHLGEESADSDCGGNLYSCTSTAPNGVALGRKAGGTLCRVACS